MASATATPAKRSGKRGGGRPASGARDEDGATEYEMQRLSRIRENQERLEALGLRSLASALLGASGSGKQGPAAEEEESDAKKSSQKKKKGRGGHEDDEDDEYQPSEEDESGGSSSAGEEKIEEEEEKGHASPPGARQRPGGKKKISSNAVKLGKKLHIQSRMDELDDMDDDAALQQAIAISLEEPMKCSGTKGHMGSQISVGDSTDALWKNNVNSTQATPGGGKRRKANVKRPQMTEDELVVYFFSFDEVGKGSITVRDLMRMAVAHDFCWTDKEIADMIYLFDSNGDGQLSLDDFRTIVSRCNMMREPVNG